MLEKVKSARQVTGPRSRVAALSGVLLALLGASCAGDPAAAPTPPGDQAAVIPEPAPEIPPPAPVQAWPQFTERSPFVPAPPVPPDPMLEAFGGRLFRFTEARIHARAGHQVIVPIVLAPGVLPGEGVRVRVGDGVERVLPLVRVGVDSSNRPPRGAGVASNAARHSGWFVRSPGAGRWVVSGAPDAAAKLPLGAWVVPIDIPAGSGATPRVLIEDVPAPLVMHDDRDVAAAATRGAALLAEAASSAWSGADAAWVAGVLAELEQSPLAAWRVDAARRAAGLGAATQGAAGEAGVVRRAGQDDGAALLGAITAQWSWRWHLALGRLRAADARLARAVADRLVLSVRLDDARRVPAWPAESAELDGLLTDLLDPDLEDPDAAARVTAWLDAQPGAIAWVIDDAGRADVVASDAAATIGVANLTDDPAVCWARPDRAASGAAAPSRLEDDLVRLGPRRLGEVLVACPPTFGIDTAQAAATNVTPVRVRVGAGTLNLGVFAPAAKFNPPGFALGPLALDLTHGTWLRGAGTFGGAPQGPTPEPATSVTAGLLHRASVPAEGRSASALVLYVECATPTPVGPGESDFVRVWLGPTGRPALVLAVDQRGRVVDQTASSRAAAVAPDPKFEASSRTVRALSEPTRWRAWVPIPDSALSGSVLRIGLERHDARGERSAWPRPMMPWQHEPGRAAIDTGTWRP